MYINYLSRMVHVHSAMDEAKKVDVQFWARKYGARNRLRVYIRQRTIGYKCRLRSGHRKGDYVRKTPVKRS